MMMSLETLKVSHHGYSEVVECLPSIHEGPIPQHRKNQASQHMPKIAALWRQSRGLGVQGHARLLSV